MVIEKEAKTLREMINCNSTCAQRFDEAERLAKSLFTRDDSVPLPYFTAHDASHSEAIEKNLNQIIWGTEKEPLSLTQYDFVPTPEEAMYLLSAAWLHDIGMWYGIREGEDPNDLKDPAKVMELRREHEIRTVKYIHEVWRFECGWSPDEKTWLSNICAYHRRHRQIGTFEPSRIISRHDGRAVRLVALAALLRLADACHEDQSRAPGRLMALYVSLEMPKEAAVHWEKAKLITAVDFDHTNREIILTGQCPPKFDFGLGEFDLGEIVEIVRKDIDKELQSVQPILLPFPNVYFGEVKADIFTPFHSGLYEEKQYLALWPYLLDKSSNSTEAAAALVQVLLFCAEEGKRTGKFGVGWQEEIHDIVNKVTDSRPLDFMIMNICNDVRKIASSPPKRAMSVHSLSKHIEEVMKTIKENCKRIADNARRIIEPGDVLVVYGHSTDIEKSLRNLEKQHSLYIVDCYSEATGTHLESDENKRIRDLAHELGFTEVRYLQLQALAQAVGELKRNNRSCKLLLSTHGVPKKGGFICKVGSYTLAAIAKKLKAKVVVFADDMKVLKNGIPDKEIARPEKLFSSKECKQRLVPKMDLVPRSLVDFVVTEKDVFAAKKLKMTSL